MNYHAGLDVSQQTTSICIVDEERRIVAERKVVTCPDAIAAALVLFELTRAGLETGPLSVWLWTPSHEARALLAARGQLVQIRCSLENETRGVLRTFGILFGKRVGGFAKRAEEIVAGELDASPTIRTVITALMKARTDILVQIRALDTKVRSISRGHATVRHFMTVPGIGVITALGFVATIDDPTRFRRSSSAGAYLGLTPKIYASGETRKVGRISRRGDDFLRRSLYEAANALLTRTTGSRL